MNPISLLVFAATLALSTAMCVVPGVVLGEGNKVFDWTVLGQNGLQFAFARGTIGASHVDPTFATNWEHLEKMNITHGTYHEYNSNSSAHENFANVEKNIFGMVNFTSKHLFTAVFSENTGKLSPDVLADNFHTFLWLIEHKHRFKPIIFTNKPFWDSAIGSAANDYDFGSYRLWIYDVSNRLFQPDISSPWKDFFIWSFSSLGLIKGAASANNQLLWMKQ